MDSSFVAKSASDAAELGVNLAKDLYCLASEYPSVECQIGRIAQAFVDINLTLADLASALPSSSSLVSLTPPCLERVGALIHRVHMVQTAFLEGLGDNNPAPVSGKIPSSSKKLNSNKSSNKLGRLKTLFPGSGAAERFTEMEWMRNTLALLATVFRLVTSQAHGSDDSANLNNQNRFRIASETLTSAVIIYVRTIEQRLAGPEDDDQSDDEEPVTGPGSLLYVAPVAPYPRDSKKGKSKSKALVEVKVDAADWIYENLRDRIKESDRAERLPRHFVEWLLEEAVLPKTDEKPAVADAAAAEPTDGNTAVEGVSKDKRNPSTERGEPITEPKPEPQPAPVFLSKKAAKKLAKLKGKAKAVATKPTEPERPSDDRDIGTTDNNTAEDSERKAMEDMNASSTDTAGTKKGGFIADASGAPEATPAHQADTPKAAATQTEPGKSRDAKIGQYDLEQDHDDLPPPYPSPESFIPHGRGQPFGASHFPYPPANPMAYQTPPGASFDMPPFMQPQPAMLPIGFYPLHPQYMAAPQSFFSPRGATGDTHGPSDLFDGLPPSRPFPGIRRESIERSYRDAPSHEMDRGGSLAPRSRPAAYGKFEEGGQFDNESPVNRRRDLTGRRRRESDDSQGTNDNKENEKYGSGNKIGDETSPGKGTADGGHDTQARPELSLERAVYRPKKPVAVSSKPTKKGDGKASAETEDEAEKHYSDAETVDIRDALPLSNNSGKKRNGNVSTSAGKTAGQANGASSPPVAPVLPTPPTPPSAAGEDDNAIEAETSKSKTKSKAKQTAKNTRNAKARALTAEGDHNETEPRNENRDDSEYESADEGNDGKNDKDKNANDDGNETQFSPDTEHKVFTPPDTPPHIPHPGEAPVPPPAAHIHSQAPQPGPLGAGGAAGPGGFPGSTSIPYFTQPPHPMMGSYPYQTQPRGGPEATGYGLNVDMGMGAVGTGFGAGDATIDSMWASFWNERLGMPPPAAPWVGTQATRMNGPRSGPTAAAERSSSWIRGDDHAKPVRGPPPQDSGAHPPPRPQPWNRYRNRGSRDDHHDDGHAVFGYSEDDNYDDYDHRYPRDRRYYSDDYDDRGPVTSAPYHDDYPPRRRSLSPPYHTQDRRRQYHEQQRQQRPRYHPDDSPPRGWERDDRDRREPRGSPNMHGGSHQQQPSQPPYRNAFHPYYDQPRRASVSKGATPAEWGWPGDVKQPLDPQQTQLPQMAPQMPPMFPHAPPPHNSHPAPGWDGGWNETYRQSRGHAEFAMTEVDG
ncbi:hypothetical protein SPBR_08096 [Sporothrix brasiliensis 5110]|uniref:Uncharacterized protein n=1 Tax=Sporothrix brasiliensis 5110 TaxID=1398154 RepID=A0A0C2F6C7_9PEZI|nr:uncharacterized protein SPBR_08096 [Sporothrix brasiliensis 5110]KIH86553.1 hypothetical protein SPBR_08096 [Sporothrix brasiliensis 5110]